jgi:hypothetical protein
VARRKRIEPVPSELDARQADLRAYHVLRRLRIEATDPSLLREGWPHVAFIDRQGVADAIAAASAEPDPHRRLALAEALWAERLAVGLADLARMEARR